MGTYDVTLIVDRGSQIDTLVKPGYITVNAPVGIVPVKQNNSVVFPNPCNGNFKIAIDGNYDMKILDILGSIVYTRSANSGTGSYNLGLPPGTYFVSIESDKTKLIQKLLVN